MSDELVPGDPGRLRASDADRERVAQALQVAVGEGRLTMAELQERLDIVYGSKTVGELEPLTHDLPVPVRLTPPLPQNPVPHTPVQHTAAAHSGRSARDLVGGTATSSVAIAVMSQSERKGVWVVPHQFTAVAYWGSIELDLTRARYAVPEVTITVVAVMGGVTIVVDPATTVIVSGVGVMGAFEDKARCEGRPGGPVIRVNGLAFWGSVDVRRPDDPHAKELKS